MLKGTRTTSLAIATALALGLASCASSHSARVDVPTAFDPSFAPQWEHSTARMHMEPLRPAVAELDFNGFMSSIDHLRDALRWGNWPSPDFTLEANTKDLARHWKEFGTGEAFAYTVLTPDRSRCIGCVYINPDEENARGANVAYWVTDDMLASDFDRHLVAELMTWFERDWPLDTVAFPTRVEYARGIQVAKDVGLVAPPIEGTEDKHLAFTWTR